jgi:hypothetical protein
VNSTPTCLHHTTAIPLLYHRVSQVAYVCFILAYRDERQNCKENELKPTFYPLSFSAKSSQRSPSPHSLHQNLSSNPILLRLHNFKYSRFWCSIDELAILHQPTHLELFPVRSCFVYPLPRFRFRYPQADQVKSHRIIQIAESPISTLSNEYMT